MLERKSTSIILPRRGTSERPLAFRRNPVVQPQLARRRRPKPRGYRIYTGAPVFTAVLHRGGKGIGTAGSGGARRRRARGTSGHLRGRTPAPQGRRRQAPQDRRRQAPQDRRRRLTFFWGWAEIRRSRLWPLKVVLDALRVHAAQYKTRPSQAQHVAGRAGPAGARGASQLLGNRRIPRPRSPFARPSSIFLPDHLAFFV
jgi:hypothetical protein